MSNKLRIEEAIAGYAKGVPHTMSLTLMLGGGLIVLALMPNGYEVIGPVFWMFFVLIRLAFVFPSGEWASFTPKDFSGLSWRMFIRGFFGFKCWDWERGDGSGSVRR